MRITDKKFFTAPALELAENLLGKVLVRITDDGRVIKRRVVETEAYGGADDSASHAARGQTKRNAPMFDIGGTVYVYLCYGIFDMLNIVSGPTGQSEAVLIRGIEGAIGPGRTSRALEIARALNREDITTSSKIYIEDDGYKPDQIQKLPRVGINYASACDQAKLWRLKIELD